MRDLAVTKHKYQSDVLFVQQIGWECQCCYHGAKEIKCIHKTTTSLNVWFEKYNTGYSFYLGQLCLALSSSACSYTGSCFVAAIVSA